MSRASIIIFSFLLVISAIGLNITIRTSADISERTADVLIDFGDGIAKWESVELAGNYTAINATEKACKELNLTLGVSWSDYGAFLYQIGDKQNKWPGAWWHFWLWNSTLKDWELSQLGASSVILSSGDVISWSFVEDIGEYPNSKPATSPIPTSTIKYPSVSFRNNIYNTGNAELFSNITNDIIWKFNTTSYEVDSSPAAAYGRVYITTWTGFYCLNENNGSVVWNTSIVRGMSSPTVYDNKIFVGGKDGKLYCLNASSGEILWSTILQPNVVYTGISSSPKILDDKIFVGTSNESGGYGKIYAIYANNGTVIWEYTSSSIYLSTASIHNDRVFIGTMGIFDSTNYTWSGPYGVLCLNTNNGSLVWFFQTNKSVASSPAVYNNSIYFSSKDGYLYRVNMNGAEIWKKEIGISTSSPAIENGRIYVGSGTFGSSGKICAFDENGNKLWEFVPNGGVQSSITVGDGKLFFATNTQNGTIYSIDANGNLLWKVMPKPENYILGSPVLANNKLFIASDNGFVYCFGENKKPIAYINAYSLNITLNTEVTFNASNSNDVGGEIVNYTWEFGDGVIGYGKTVDHTYKTAEIFKTNLTIVDDEGTTNITSVEINITNAPSTPSITTLPYTDTDGSYNVTWMLSNYADTYELYENGVLLSSEFALSKAFTGKANGTYAYKIRGVNTNGTSSFSNEITITVHHPAWPEIPAITTVPYTDTDGNYVINWTSSIYAVKYALEENGVEIYNDTNLTSAFMGKIDGSYVYCVKAWNPNGTSDWSSSITIKVDTKPKPTSKGFIPGFEAVLILIGLITLCFNECTRRKRK